ncbi:MAG: hypothetical protein ACLR6J_11640 [Parabacteroides merdae]
MTAICGLYGKDTKQNVGIYRPIAGYTQSHIGKSTNTNCQPVRFYSVISNQKMNDYLKANAAVCGN